MVISVNELLWNNHLNNECVPNDNLKEPRLKSSQASLNTHVINNTGVITNLINKFHAFMAIAMWQRPETLRSQATDLSNVFMNWTIIHTSQWVTDIISNYSVGYLELSSQSIVVFHAMDVSRVLGPFIILQTGLAASVDSLHGCQGTRTAVPE